MRALFLAIPVTFMAAFQANAQSCPDETLYGAEYSGSGEDFYLPQRYSVVAGGGVSVYECFNETTQGYVTTNPDFTIEINDLSGYDVSFRTESTCDTVLLVNMPDRRWRYNDDIPGQLDSEVRLGEQIDGIYDIWVGTVDADMCDATLVVETFSTS